MFVSGPDVYRDYQAGEATLTKSQGLHESRDKGFVSRAVNLVSLLASFSLL